MTTLYETQATAIGGRHGAAATADGRWRFNLAIPRQLGGDGSEGINPEQLFAVGYAACFLTAIRDASMIAWAAEEKFPTALRKNSAIE